jgi:2'-5' RNA ligase
MARAIELFFDRTTDTEIRRLWKVLDDAGLPSLRTRTHRHHRPHVTLAVCDALDTRLRGRIRDCFEPSSLPVLRLGSLGIFPGDERVLYLLATPTDELLGLHDRVVGELAEDEVEVWEHYRRGRWVPHCTLAQELPDDRVGDAVDLLRGWGPWDAPVAGVGLTDTETGEVETLIRADT